MTESSWLHRLAHRMGLNEITVEQVAIRGHEFVITRCAVCRVVEKTECHSHKCFCRRHKPEVC